MAELETAMQAIQIPNAPPARSPATYRQKEKRIYHWMEREPTTGKADTYFFQFASRVNTLDCSGW